MSKSSQLNLHYTDSEVIEFHPIVQQALELALVNLGKSEEYAVCHHMQTGALEMDFSILNRATGKVFTVIEVKRTPNDVRSSRYQYQAMDYVVQNGMNSEASFYILTNIEDAIAFHYTPTRPRPLQQILEPSFEQITRFNEENIKSNTKRLADYFTRVLYSFFSNSWNYAISLADLEETIFQVKESKQSFSTTLALVAYEYIRGVFKLTGRSHSLPDIRSFNRNIELICKKASSINFNKIFNYSHQEFTNRFTVEDSLLRQMFKMGNSEGDAEAIANLLHQILSLGHEHDGEVATDPELARVLAHAARAYHGELSKSEKVIDPAAGSGNLLSAAIDVFSLRPDQIIANDINLEFSKLLSLRLGLHYPISIKKNFSPLISSVSIEKINDELFSQVGIALLNPPFLFGVKAVDRKGPLLQAIRKYKRKDPETLEGQLGLEITFLELLCAQVKIGTTMAVIFPANNIQINSLGGKIIRHLLLDSFGLQAVINYPME